MSSSSLPNIPIEGASDTTRFFNRETKSQINYPANEVDAVIGFFLKRDFDQVAAVNAATILLEQASKDNVPVFSLIDTLKGLNNVQLSNVVAQILNLNRSKCSTLGYRIAPETALYEQRNIIVNYKTNSDIDNG